MILSMSLSTAGMDTARQIVAALVLRRFGAEERPQLDARRQRQRESADDHVVVVVFETALVLRLVDEPHRRFDAENPEVAHVRRHDPLEHRIVLQKLDRQRFALGVSPHPAFGRPAGLVEETGCLAQQLAVGARSVGDRRLVDLAEHFRPELAPERLEELQLWPRGLPFRLEIGAFEDARGAPVDAVEQVELDHSKSKARSRALRTRMS